jgi:hypothetical protein
MMNKKAQELGLMSTHFVNADGLPTPKQLSTARDIANLSRSILLSHPNYARVFSMPDFYFNNRKYKNTNTDIKYNSSTGKYTHSTIRNVDPSFYGIHCYIDGNTNMEVCQEIAPNGDISPAVRPPQEQTYTYEFTPITGMIKRIEPSCNIFSNTDNYCSTNGSAVKPEEWGTK